MRSPARIISPKRSAATPFTIRPIAALNARSAGGWITGPSCGASGGRSSAFPLISYGFHDARRRTGRDNLREAETGFAQKGRTLGFCTFLASHLHKHRDIEYFPRMRRVAGGQHHFDDQQAASRIHRLADMAEDRKG